jgi:ubiquinone/menaquinone biosynthesis C-methylase UbiE
MKLFDIVKDHDGKGGGKWVHYFDIYEKHLNKFVGKDIFILEIGVCNGGSLQIWKKYFGDKCKIVGIDNDPYTEYEEERIIVKIGSQNNVEFLNEVISEYGTPDIIIDDGSHIQSDILQTLSVLYPVLNPGGVYIIEDTHTAYMHEYGGGISVPFNINTVLSRSCHDPTVEFISEPYTQSIPHLDSICFYNSVTVLEKKLNLEKVTPFFYGEEKYKNTLTDKKTPVSQITQNGDQEIISNNTGLENHTEKTIDYDLKNSPNVWDNINNYSDKFEENFNETETKNQNLEEYKEKETQNHEDIFKWNF